MSQGLANALKVESGNLLTVMLGKSFHAGYWSGRRLTISKARNQYSCDCGKPEHVIKKGDFYLIVTPDRMAAYCGKKFRNRLHIDNLSWPLKVLNKKGEVVTILIPVSHK
ncbi:MAG: hypothetical protein K6U04_01575 [Armatimonadetes bacterium]|nr:hypothetical protein [Armatimonadota bacterium]